MFEQLKSPTTIGTVSLRNRICFLAHRTNFARKGRLDERHMAYYRRRAEGGCGLIIVGEMTIHENDRPWEAMIETYHPRAAGDFKRLTDAVHRHDTIIFARLNHHGFQGSGAVTRRAVWGPSALSDIAFGETAKPMEPEDMTAVKDAFEKAARTVQKGGFDGIEIDMGPESLLRQFLSPLSNHRQDEYGGSLENRMRFPLEVLEAVQKTVGEDFTVGIRLCADEKFWGAIEPAESCEMARIFETTGRIHFINVAVGTYYNLHLVTASMHTPEGFTIETAEQIKKTVSVPVIASHQIYTPVMAEKILANGQADAIGLVRNLICDPDWPNKALEGRTYDIRSCVRDNQDCIGRINQQKPLCCIQNPNVGFEAQSPIRGPQSAIKKRVIVVGAGPAGLAAAVAAREKGHRVTVCEKKDRPGGQINLLVKGAGREGMREVIRYLTRRLEQLDVSIVTNHEATLSWIHGQNPDAVIVATGSKPIERPVAGNYGPPRVLSVWDVMEERYPVGDRVLFVDEHGGHHGAATVERLADQGKKVDMITSDLFIGIELAPLGDLYLTRQRLLQKGVTFTTDLRVEEIQNHRLTARNVYTHDPVVFEGYDTLVLDMGNEVIDGLYRSLKGHVKELVRVGDCVAPRNIGMAVFEGHGAGVGL